MILDFFHSPVLLPRVLELLQIKKGGVYLDATVGGGGYAGEIAKKGGSVIGLDMDSHAIDYLRKKSIKNLTLFNSNFSQLSAISNKAGFDRVDGVIFDFGLSSFQLDKSKRGFSFRKNEALDMRFDITAAFTAETVINNYSQEQLYEIFTKYSEELYSRPIAAAVIRARSLKGKITTTWQLRDAIISGVKKNKVKNINSVLARIFQAVRIEVNSELTSIEKSLPSAVALLEKGGRIVVISYHSLEDRLVKKFLNLAHQEKLVKIITKKPEIAGFKETSANPRSRSAKLRAAEKL